MTETTIANLSQEYIDHLTEQTFLADNRQKELTKDYEVKQNELTDAQNWQAKIELFWTRVKATEALSKKVFADIDILLDQAEKINRNIEYTLQAVKILVCNVREVSRVLEQMTDEYQELKRKIDTATTRDRTFKPGKIMDTLNDLGKKLTIAGQAADVAIEKVLDLLKAVYSLHRTFDSERNAHQDWVIDYTVTDYVEENGELKPIVLYEEVKILYGNHTIEEPGLEWNVRKLKALLEEGMPQPDYDTDGYPCQDAEVFIPTFPLPQGQNRYYDISLAQHQQAEGKTRHIDAELTKIGNQKRMAESSFNAFNAALIAAKAAKNPVPA